MTAKLIVSISALAVALAAAAGIVAISKLTVIKPAPEVRFNSLAGEPLSTSTLRGKVLLVNFWGTYCAPCIREMPKVVETYRKFASRGYETLAVATRHDKLQNVARFVEQHALPFKVALDSSGEAAKAFGNVRITPTMFLIDKQGRVLRRYIGQPDWPEIHELVERELGS
jgi:peroxiredoxin